jgi:hypothetical protein
MWVPLSTTAPARGSRGGTPWSSRVIQLCTSRDIVIVFAMEKECVCYTVPAEFHPDENCWMPGYCEYCESIDLNKIDDSNDSNDDVLPK